MCCLFLFGFLRLEEGRWERGFLCCGALFGCCCVLVYDVPEGVIRYLFFVVFFLLLSLIIYLILQ